MLTACALKSPKSCLGRPIPALPLEVPRYSPICVGMDVSINGFPEARQTWELASITP